MIKRYYRLELDLVSGMNVGNGENENSDKDLLRDSRQVPFIPGSTMAGLYRAFFDAKTQETFFGKELDRERLGQENYDNSLTDSKVIVYDAVILEGKPYRVTKRDSVALDDYKTAVRGAKFDMEILEPGVRFVTFIEQNADSQAEVDMGAAIAAKIKTLGLSAGGKGSRGMGRLMLAEENEAVKSDVFDLSVPAQKKNWLKFDMYRAEEPAWKVYDISKAQKAADASRGVITLRLRQKGGLSIRTYSTAVSTKDHPEPDYEQMAYGADGRDGPYIPGTSWAGAFRHHMKKLGLPFDILDKEMGCAGDEKRRSRTTFGESRIEGHTDKMITRNAIDRFSGGTVDGALYTEKSCFYGDTCLEIGYAKDCGEEFVKSLAASIVDLHFGLLSVGGLTAVGRGLFEITACQVGGKDIFPAQEPAKAGEMYQEIFTALKGGGIA